MKKIFLIVLMFITSKSFSQLIDFPLKDSLVTYEGVVKLSDTTIKKGQLFSTAKAWFANAFKDANSVIKDQDLEGGKIIAKGIDDEYTFTIDISVKDGRYRYRIYDLERYSKYETGGFLVKSISKAYSRCLHDDPPRLLFESKKAAMKAYSKIFYNVNEQILSTIASLKGYMNKARSDDF